MINPAVRPDKPSMWRAGLDAFRLHFKEWRKLAIIFFLVTTPVTYASLVDNGEYGFGNPVIFDNTIELFKTLVAQDNQVLDSLQSLRHDESPPTIAGAISDQKKVDKEKVRQNKDKEKIERLVDKMLVSDDVPSPVIGLLVMVGLVINFIEIYIFYVFFLRREGIAPDVNPSVSGFFFYIWKSILQVLLVSALLTLSIFVIEVGGLFFVLLLYALHLPKAVSVVLSIVVIGGAVAAACAYWETRYILVGPLAAQRVPATLKACTILTRGKILRVFGNFLLFFVTFMLPIAVFGIASIINFGAFAVNNVPLAIGLSIVTAAFNVFFVGLYAAFKVTVCRILYDEKKDLPISIMPAAPAIPVVAQDPAIAVMSSPKTSQLLESMVWVLMAIIVVFGAIKISMHLRNQDNVSPQQQEQTIASVIQGKFEEQVEKCWDLPKNVPADKQVPVKLVVKLNRDGTVQDVYVEDQARLSGDKNYKLMADAAVKIFDNPSCKKFDLPAENYEIWKQIFFTFDPRQTEARK